jgi:hypothetical protein
LDRHKVQELREVNYVITFEKIFSYNYIQYSSCSFNTNWMVLSRDFRSSKHGAHCE